MQYIKNKFIFLCICFLSFHHAYGKAPCHGKKGYHLYSINPLSGDLIKGGFIAKTVKIKTIKHWWGPFQGLRISHNFILSPDTQICDNVKIKGQLHTHGKVIISGDADLNGNIVINNNLQNYPDTFSQNSSFEPIRISGHSTILDFVHIYGSAQIQDRAQISGYAQIHDKSRIYGSANIQGHALVKGSSQIGDSVVIKDFATIQKHVRLEGNITCQDQCFLDGNIQIINTGNHTHISLEKNVVFSGSTYIQTNRNSTFDGGQYIDYQYEDGQSPVPDNAVEHIYPPEIIDQISREIVPSTLNNEQTCRICFDSINGCGKTIQFLKCNHVFHKKCATSWACYKLSCPLCNESFDF
ncbi:MAG: RING finger domain-containing protein [Oligoflexales bacterium]